MIIGFDMDGVVAARPRLFRLNHTRGKYRIHLSIVEQWFWWLVMYLRQPSWDMIKIIREHKSAGNELFLVTGRLSFLYDLTWWWLKRYDLERYFNEIIINTDEIQPHIFKAREIKKNKLNTFYEDEVFTAKYLKENTRAKICQVIDNGKKIIEIN